MAKLRMGGHVTGTAVEEQGYLASVDDHDILVHVDEIDVTWRSAPEDSSEAEKQLYSWLRMRLLAMSLTTGLPADFVPGDWTEFAPSGKTRTSVSKSFSFPWRARVYQRPRQLVDYEALSTLLESDGDARKAADRYRRAMAFQGDDDDACLAMCYLSAEGLVRRLHSRESWKEAANTVGMDPQDLLQLWASTQFGRHDEARRAAEKLARMNRPALNAPDCCQRLRAFIVAYLAETHGFALSP